jgi:hypothetical protein
MKVADKRRLRSKRLRKIFFPRLLRVIFWLGPKLVPWVRVLIEIGRLFRN